MDQTFTLLPIHMDPMTKSLSSPLPTLQPTLGSLNQTHKLLLPLPAQTPPPPLPTNPKRSAQVAKMREQGNTSLRRGGTPAAHQEAIQLYTYGLEMALGRPGWEPVALVREEGGALFANRAQAYMAKGMWAEGAADGAASVEMKRGGNGKAWWRRGRCLVEMGRWEEAGDWVREGLEVEGNEGELAALGREIEAHLKRGGR